MGYTHSYSIKRRKDGGPDIPELRSALSEVMPEIQACLEKYGNKLGDGHGTPGTRPYFEYGESPHFSFNQSDEDGCASMWMGFDEDDYSYEKYEKEVFYFFVKTNRGDYDIPVLETLFRIKDAFAKRNITLNVSVGSLGTDITPLLVQDSDTLKAMDAHSRKVLGKTLAAARSCGKWSDVFVKICPRPINLWDAVPHQMRDDAKRFSFDNRQKTKLALDHFSDHLKNGSGRCFIDDDGFLKPVSGNERQAMDAFKKWRNDISKHMGTHGRKTLDNVIKSVGFRFFHYADGFLMAKKGKKTICITQEQLQDDKLGTLERLSRTIPGFTERQTMEFTSEFFPCLKSAVENKNLRERFCTENDSKKRKPTKTA